MLATIAVLMLPATINVATGALPESWRPYLVFAWPVVVLLAAPLIISEIRRAGVVGRDRRGKATRLDTAATELAAAVEHQWKSEITNWDLHRIELLNVSWSRTSRPIAPEPTAGAEKRSLGLRLPPSRFAGDLADIAERFLGLPNRQLVVLGDPGSGKTVLAVRLTLDLLARRDELAKVPVLFAVSTWDPGGEHLHSWLARRLTGDYRIPPDIASGLVTDGRILPILDGLDELPDELHAAAIEEIDRAVGRTSPVAVFCRGTQYEIAVETRGRVLADATVIELNPLDRRDIARFITDGLPASDRRWGPVLGSDDTTTGPLADALSTPLMASLARAAYAAPGTRPTELLGFTGRTEIEGHLLDAYLPSVYSDQPPPPGARRRPGYRHDQAVHWLTFLATNLYDEHHGFAWWRPNVFTIALRWMSAVTIGIVFLLALAGAVVPIVFDDTAAGQAARATIASLFWAITSSLASPNRRSRDIRHVPTPFQVHNQRFSGTTLLINGLTFGFLVLNFLSPPLDTDLTSFVLATTGATLLVVARRLLDNAANPSESARTSSPRSALRAFRIAVGARAVMTLLGPIFATVATVLLTDGWVRSASLIGIGIGTVVGLLYVAEMFFDDWLAFLLLRGWLAVTGRAPWRMMAFLDDAHRRGVLRQIGATYHFRHALLADRLRGR